MPQDKAFRHPYDELRRITEFPLPEVALLGRTEALDRLTRLLDAAPEVARTRSGEYSAETRLVIADDDPARLAELLARQPLPRTCVVLATGVGFPATRLPLPGMCLNAELTIRDRGLRAVLLPRAGTVPEALELAAELLYALGVELEQRPVDGAPE